MPTPAIPTRRDLRNACLCAAAIAAAFFLVNPFANMPFDDDWSYSFTVRQLLETGRLIYNGWSAPVLITHVLWGALFAKLFGYSFVVLRFSTLPLAIGCAAITYLLARAADLRPPWAVFISFSICLSPLFLPLALSFMTDVPALFFTLVCLYLFIRSAKSQNSFASVALLAIGILFGIIGGMGRQTVWVAPLSVIPYLAFHRRRVRWFVSAAILGWLIVIADIFLTLRWFNAQPWVFLDPPLIQCIRQGLSRPGIFLTNLLMVCFTIILCLLPAALPFTLASLARFWRQRKTWRGAVTAIVVCALSACIALHPAFGMGPWLYNILTITGVIGDLELSGHRPISLPLPVRGILSALVLSTCYFLLARAVELALEPRTSLAKLRDFLRRTNSQPVFPILAIFSSAYFLLMIVRSAQDLVYDRYCLPLLPCVAIFLTYRWRHAIAWPLLAIFIAYALASTQDNLALAAARRAAVDLLESRGIPRNQIAAGFEFDFYTQLEEAGHVNRYGILNPPHAFDSFQQGYTPALKPRYRVESTPAADTLPSSFAPIDFISWLPPFQRRIYIDQFKNPWWLDPQKAGKLPDPTSYETY